MGVDRGAVGGQGFNSRNFIRKAKGLNQTKLWAIQDSKLHLGPRSLARPWEK